VPPNKFARRSEKNVYVDDAIKIRLSGGRIY